MLHNQVVLKISQIEYEILKAIGNLILNREEEKNNNKKTTINAYSVSKISGCSYPTTKKYLKKLKDL